MQDDFRLIRGDCLEVMPTLEVGSMDLILADLPYGTTACKWDTVIPLDPLWACYRRLLKPRGAVVLTASQPFTSILVMSNRDWFKYCWVWEKSVSGDCMNAKNKPLKKHEDIIVFSSGTTANGSENRMTYNPQGLTPSMRKRSGTDYGATGGSFKVPRPSHAPYIQETSGFPVSVVYFPHDTEKSHPTQKPVALVEYLIKTYSNEGDLVLDNTMGSGTTGVACHNTWRQFIGIEKDPKIFATAERRIHEARTSMPLFGNPS